MFVKSTRFKQVCQLLLSLIVACDYLRWLPAITCEVLSTMFTLQKRSCSVSLSSWPTFVPWDVEIRPCTSGGSSECQQRASRSTELQFPPSITSISRSLFANFRALAKSFSSVVFLVRLSRQFGLTGRKATWRSEFPLVTISSDNPAKISRNYAYYANV